MKDDRGFNRSNSTGWINFILPFHHHLAVFWGAAGSTVEADRPNARSKV